MRKRMTFLHEIFLEKHLLITTEEFTHNRRILVALQDMNCSEKKSLLQSKANIENSVQIFKSTLRNKNYFPKTNGDESIYLFLNFEKSLISFGIMRNFGYPVNISCTISYFFSLFQFQFPSILFYQFFLYPIFLLFFRSFFCSRERFEKILVDHCPSICWCLELCEC